MATYGTGIDQSQHAKSVSRMIKHIIEFLTSVIEFLAFDM